jgi:hypothetical protein
MPHIRPQNQHQKSVSCGVAPSTPSRSCVWIDASSQGATNQENMPPVIQNISQDQP